MMPKTLYLMLPLLPAALLLYDCNKKSDQTGRAPLITTNDTVGYIIGRSLALSYRDVKNNVTESVYFQGFKDQYEGKALKLTPEEMQRVMTDYMKKEQQKENEKRIASEKRFLKKNKKKKGVVTTASGLQYMVITEGNGLLPVFTDSVQIAYKGMFMNNEVFDSTTGPVIVGIGKVIKGWAEALLRMKTGSKYRVFIPSELAYGAPKGKKAGNTGSEYENGKPDDTSSFGGPPDWDPELMSCKGNREYGPGVPHPSMNDPTKPPVLVVYELELLSIRK